ncbi:MAG: hypothetical protein ABSB35_16650 [Bryobacteraceae bacterium]|jgi:hypothetical protein
MTHGFAVMLIELSLLGSAVPLLTGETLKPPVQVSKTERVSFGPGGTIRFDHSYGDLIVEGWDRPEVEITVIKSMPFDYKLKQPEEATKHLDRIQVAIERKSGAELIVSTTPQRLKGSVAAEYEIHAPRDTKLIIHHGTGSVSLSDMSADIEATCSRGDILLLLRDSGSYSIDAKNKFGVITSDFDGNPHPLRYRLGESYATPNSPSSSRIQLRMGFGGITIKALPPEAYAAQSTK